MQFKLANILFSSDEFLEGHEDLLYRGKARPIDGGEALEFTGGLDLLTYLNALPLVKWRQYASIDNARIRFELSGDTCVAALAHAFPAGDGREPRIVLQKAEKLQESPQWTGHEIEVALDGAVLVGLRLATTGSARIRNAYFFTDIEPGRIRPVRLALSTTTFCNEQYIMPNIRLVEERVLGSGEPVSSAFHMFVVDNGRTLDTEALSNDGVTVVHNPNVGGSGGFTRGMIEALEWEGGPFTHILLMDDDVHVFPESFIRTFNLLSLANDRYADAFVSGAMLKLQEPNIQFEDISYVPVSGSHRKVKPNLDISTLADLVRNEAIPIDENERTYGAWWYCCIPLEAVRQNGLPLPFFIRFDDIEYGLRCNRPFMCMSGICVWHSQFLGRFRASTDIYQYQRNMLITAACDQVIDMRLLMLKFWHNFMLCLRFLDYDQADFWLDALEHYLAGPELLKSIDGAALMKENSARNERLVPVAELDQELIDNMEIDLSWLGNEFVDRSFVMKMVEMLPYSKNILPDPLLNDRATALDYAGNASPRSKTSFRRNLVALDMNAENGHVRTVDRERYRGLVKRYRALRDDYRKRGEEVAQSWRDAMPELTSVEFWKQYLADRS